MADELNLAQNLHFVEEQYELFRERPEALDPSWRRLFGEPGAEPVAARIGGDGDGQAVPAALPAVAIPATGPSLDAQRAVQLFAMVQAYRVRGHIEANLDPLGAHVREAHPDLDPASYGFTDADMDRVVPPVALVGDGPMPLRELIARLRATYCASIGVEYMHIPQPERRLWLQRRMEPSLNRTRIDRATQVHVLESLIAATELERFIEAKYVGTKRFSLEGGETLIPLMDRVFEAAGGHGIAEAVIGMAHRGRLNVLANLMKMQPSMLFSEFEDFDPEAALGSGDVKYHLGFSTDHTTRAGKRLHLSLAFNPSHLEAVDPVVVGRVRAKQRRRGDSKHEQVLGILIHGDAAFSGQGLVAETLNLSDLKGYRTGGTIHIVVNNQIGFTTSPTDSRSTPYCTDVAKMIQVPIFHVNGDDPEAVLHTVDLAMEYRRAFSTDVVIDLYCFRRHGHNEIDDPSFTQPLLYERIRKHPAPYEVYGARLQQAGAVAKADIDARVERYHTTMSDELGKARSLKQRPQIDTFGGIWSGFYGGAEKEDDDPVTGVARDKLAHLAERIARVPEGFHAHPKILRMLEARAAMGKGERPLDWAMGEHLALASLLVEGGLVRMTGQDIRRGTFSQRHAVIVDIQNGNEYVPLRNLSDNQADFRAYDSCLSEAAVLGFEYGFAHDYPDGLVIWEAQFGDFANGAQVMIDQFISASEDRWKRLAGVVMLLPHGYEGQGPEHSSARLERYLTLCAEDNMQVCYPTTPAQIFHLLRRQVVRKWRKPLIVLSPKSMLRLGAAVSPLEDLTKGTFQRFLDDPEVTDPSKIERVLLCTGKICYELHDERKKRGADNTAIVRIEQLYPLHDDKLAALLGRYGNAREIVWVQEEPFNMGAFHFLEPTLQRMAGSRTLRAVTRAESASPATGSSKAHLIEQKALLEQSFA